MDDGWSERATGTEGTGVQGGGGYGGDRGKETGRINAGDGRGDHVRDTSRG